nr:hypothetical protein GW17_00040745 [Ipomoea batatas]
MEAEDEVCSTSSIVQESNASICSSLLPEAVPFPLGLPLVSLHAPDKVLFASVRYDGCGPVVHPERVLRPEPDQVAPARRVQPEYVIDLRFGEREELVGPHRPPLAAEHATGGPEVVGVDGHEERGGGDVLEVVPTADEEQPARRAAHVSGVVLVQIGAYVVLCFGPMSYQPAVHGREEGARNAEDMRMSMSFDEEISPPLDRLQSVAVLTRTSNFFAVFEHGPRQQGYGKRHWKAKLDVVAGVIVASDQVHLSLNPHQIKPNGKQKTENRKRSAWRCVYEYEYDERTPCSRPSVRPEWWRQVTLWLYGKRPERWASK